MHHFMFRVVVCIAIVAGCVAKQTQAEKITYQLSSPAQVSLAIYDADTGAMVRTLMSGVAKDAGEHTLHWDGHDRMDRVVVPGQYTWRMLATPGFTARYIGPLGINPKQQKFHDYWYGNHSGPLTVATGNGLLITSAQTENAPATLCMKLDGDQAIVWQHGYSSHPLQREAHIIGDQLISLADDTHQRTSHLLVSKLADGEQLKKFDVLRPTDKTDYRYQQYIMATNGKLAAIAYPESDGSHVVVCDLKTTDTVHKFDAPALADMVYIGDVLYVIANGQVMHVKGDTFISVINAEQLVSPKVMAFDASRSEFLVGEGAGETSETGQQIKRFSRDGKLLATYGRSGGRQDGAWVKQNFREINDIAVKADGSGRFLVAEGTDQMSRIVRVDNAGAVIREWLGPQQFYNFAAADPADTSRIIFVGGYRSKAIAQMDYQTGAWQLLESYTHPDFGNGLFPSGKSHYVRWWPRRRHGELYLVADAGHAGIVRVDRDAKRLVPVAAAGRRNDHPLMIEAAKLQGIDHKTTTGFIWTDSNTNGGIDVAEIVLVRDKPMPNGVVHIDDDWNVAWRPRFWRANDAQPTWQHLPNLAPSDAALPTWDATGINASIETLPDAAIDLAASGTDAFAKDAEGAHYMLINGNRAGGDRHGAVWPTMITGSARLIKWNPDGSLAWTVGKHAVDDAFTPGIIRGNVVVADKSIGPGFVYSQDGLYAGNLLDHRANDGLPDSAYRWFRDTKTNTDSPIPWDCKQGGTIHEHHGKVYWMPMGNHYTPVYEITGWDKGQRQSGNVQSPINNKPIAQGTGLIGGLSKPHDFEFAPINIKTPRLWSTVHAGKIHGKQVDWANGPTPGVFPQEMFAIQWRGQVEAMFTEPTRLTVYNHDIRGSTQGPGWDAKRGDAKVWLGGKLILDTEAGRTSSRWIQLRAGERYNLRVAYEHAGGPEPEFSLCWETTTQERQRIPAAYFYPDYADDLPTLSLELDTHADKDVGTIRVIASQAPDEDVIVSLTNSKPKTASDHTLPSQLILPAGQTSVSFDVDVSGTATMADSLTSSLNPVANWQIANDAASVTLIQSAKSSLFDFGKGETVLLADDISDPTRWGVQNSTAKIEDGIIGPTVPASNIGFTAWQNLPMPVDLRTHDVIFYLRAKTPAGDYGGHVRVQFSQQQLGLGIFGREGAAMFGHRVRDGHYGSQQLWHGLGLAPEQETSWVNYRLHVKHINGSPIGELFMQNQAGKWIRRGKNQPGFLKVPPAMRRIELTGRNTAAGYIDAVAVSIIAHQRKPDLQF